MGCYVRNRGHIIWSPFFLSLSLSCRKVMRSLRMSRACLKRRRPRSQRRKPTERSTKGNRSHQIRGLGRSPTRHPLPLRKTPPTLRLRMSRRKRKRERRREERKGEKYHNTGLAFLGCSVSRYRGLSVLRSLSIVDSQFFGLSVSWSLH